MAATRTPIEDPAASALAARSPVRLDLLLLGAAVGLSICSLVTIGAATADDIPGDPGHYVIRQGAYVVVGLLAALAISRVDYSRLRELRFGLYGTMVALILLVLATGTAVRGSRRALELPFFSFQPAELGKILLIIALSAFIVARARQLREREVTVRVLLLALVPALLVFLQPDLGTGMVYIVIALMTLFVAGTSWRHFAAFGALFATVLLMTLAVAPQAGIQVFQPYQVDRLTAFVDPSEDPRDEGYQQAQAQIAIGSGQRTGRGADEATQTRLNFLPEHHTDFVFAVVGERFGFVGAALVLLLYALLIWRALRILTVSKNLFGALIAGGIAAMLLFQVFVNAGMNVGIMPITGVPLPLMSYGGSSVIVTFMAVGLLQSIYAHARSAEALKGRLHPVN